MKRLRITVNGTAYEVEVEELDEQFASERPLAQNRHADPGSSNSMQSPGPKAENSGGAGQKRQPPAEPAQPRIQGLRVNAPMPGTILEVKVDVGDLLDAGDVIVVLEAMKMENQITAPQDGIVEEVSVKAGVSVNAGDVLAVLN